MEVAVADLGDVEKFSTIIVASSGHMSRMHTVDPRSAAVSGLDTGLLHLLQKLPLACNLIRSQGEHVEA